MISKKLKWVYRAWRYRLVIEKQEIGFLLSKVKDSQVCMDIGAHKGAYTYWMSKAVGPSGTVFAYEPQPFLYQELKNLIEYSAVSNIKLFPFALSSVGSNASLIIPNGKVSPGASLIREMKEKDTKIKIKTITLDEFILERDSLPVDYIKCDVEGHELEIFTQGHMFFQKCRPIISVESESRHCGKRKVLDLFYFFKDLNYQGYFHDGYKMESIDKFNIDAFQIDKNRKKYINNFFFIPT